MTALECRQALIVSIRARESRAEQLTKADAYILAVKAHAKELGRRLPVPNRYAIIRQLS
jgi:hypothetical protein